jgi:hypothetical protein
MGIAAAEQPGVEQDVNLALVHVQEVQVLWLDHLLSSLHQLLARHHHRQPNHLPHHPALRQSQLHWQIVWDKRVFLSSLPLIRTGVPMLQHITLVYSTRHRSLFSPQLPNTSPVLSSAPVYSM